jgi:DNA replication licensing factor MCM4
MNLDCSNLRLYLPSKRLYNQLIRYPQEVIPLMDHILTDFYYEIIDDAFVSSMTVSPSFYEYVSNFSDLILLIGTAFQH